MVALFAGKHGTPLQEGSVLNACLFNVRAISTRISNIVVTFGRCCPQAHLCDHQISEFPDKIGHV
jgi:hypothetical protein